MAGLWFSGLLVCFLSLPPLVLAYEFEGIPILPKVFDPPL